MEDMIIHENVFKICKTLNQDSKGEEINSDYLYSVLQLILTPRFSYKEKTRKLKGGLIRSYL